MPTQQHSLQSGVLSNKLSTFCICVCLSAVACFLCMFVWFSGIQKSQAIEHGISATISTSMQMYHSSLEVNVDDRTPESDALRHEQLMPDIRSFRRQSDELRKIFESRPEKGWVVLSGTLGHLSDLVGFKTIPREVHALWANDAAGETLGELLMAQYKTCLFICMSPNLTESERLGALSKLREIAIDSLLPKLTELRELSSVWERRRMNVGKLLVTIAFSLVILSVVLAREAFIKPMVRQLEQAERDIESNNRRLEERVESRTRELSRAVEQANAAAESKARFLANISHEIRTPMNGVLGIAALLSKTDLDRRQCSHVETIVNSGRALMRIIDDVLETASIASGKLGIQPRLTSIADVIRNTVALHAPRAREKGLDLSADLSGPSVSDVLVDPDRLLQVLSNLIGNAIKFTDTGAVQVRQRAVEHAEHVAFELQVEDTGIGISVVDKDRIFEPFERVQGSDVISGAGLGLALSRTLIEDMGGTLELQSTPGMGSVFSISITLPKAERDPPLSMAAAG